ncbi:MAG: sensor histidine kinase [Sedimentisphaerales bacterium]|nr:sensor histidine kinase [Sedimentisphaerales bacterium]
MSMVTNLHGRLRNTSLTYNHGLLPVFEAVINSIHAIEERKLSTNQGKIAIEIIRDKQQDIEFEPDDKKRGPDPCKGIIGFKITDNGIGFTDPNMESFRTLDSEYKVTMGGRGVGRLLWIKAFQRVSVSSVFTDKDGFFKLRTFLFTAESGVTKEESKLAQENRLSTCIHLDGFREKYRKASRKTARAIANSLFEHCLWYFVREGGTPKITVMDENEQIALDDIYEEHMVSSAESDSTTIKDNKFELLHIKLRANSSNSHLIAYCAANRLVKEESITGKIAGLYGKLHDESGEFVYTCYVTSPFLDKTVRSERTDFDITENAGELFAETEISFSEIRDTILAKVSTHLSTYLEENKLKAKERVENFASRKAPRYRPILARIPTEKLYIDPTISDKDLELTLHKYLAEIEEQLLTTGHEIMNQKEDEGFLEYQERLQEYLKTAEDIKKSDLANYVSHRRVILELLEKAIRKGKDGRYAREDLIHKLIMPMRCDSNEVMPDSCNLWLLDERLAFHDYLASDKTLSSMPISNSTETKEPDILALNVFDNPILVSEGNKLPLASIVVIEIKRPMRNDAAEGEEKDPIEQTLGYLDRIKRGTVLTPSGRPIPKSEDIPGYCYVICDITSSIEERCRMHDAIRTSDGLGYFFYKRSFNAYVEIISFDRLVNAAKERNRAFFDKLGLPTS